MSVRTRSIWIWGLACSIILAAGSRCLWGQGLEPGSVVCWGYNTYGQLGNGTSNEAAGKETFAASYLRVQGIDGSAVFAGTGEHSLCLKSDGTLWAWGMNVVGQLGDGSTTNRTTPVQVKGITDVSTAALGTLHTLAVKSDGTLWGWGSNIMGELGRPVAPAKEGQLPDHSETPQQIKGIDSVAAVAAGSMFSVALKTDGSVWAWGINLSGQLGNGSVDKSSEMDAKPNPQPTQAVGLPKIVAISAGIQHVLALDDQGNVWAWGSNASAALGMPDLKKVNVEVKGPGEDGKETVVREDIVCPTPAKVAGLPRVKAIAAGEKCSLALGTDGTVWQWGMDTPMKEEPASQPAGGGTTQPAVAASTQASSQPADQLWLKIAFKPVKIDGLDGAVALGAGRYGRFALMANGAVMAWGDNSFYALGTGDNKKSSKPVPVKGLVGVTGMSVGLNHTLAVAGVAGDPFWKWLPGFSRLVKARVADYHAARFQAGITGNQLQDLRKTMRNLNAVLFPTDAPPPPAKGADKLTASLGKVAAEIKRERQQMEALQHKADVAISAIRQELQQQQAISGSAHPMLATNLKFYQDIYDQLPLDFAQAEGDEDSLRSAITLGANLPYSAATRRKEAIALWQQHQHAESLFKLRKAVALDPKNDEYQKQLADMEATFLRASIDKSQSATKNARDEFYKYLGESGFAKKLDTGGFDARDEGNSDLARKWYSVLTAKGKDIDSETAWAVLTTGVTRSWSGIIGRPDEEANALDATESSMTRAYKGLQVMMRLRQKGVSLPDMKNMDAAAIMKTLPAKDYLGRPYTAPQAHLLGSYIHEAMQLPDVKALLSGSQDEFDKALKQGYWDPEDVGNTWTEWVGDLSSPMNLTMFLSPMSVAGTGGKLAQVGLWGTEEMATLKALQAEGKVVSGSEAMSRLVGWKLATDALRGTATGDYIVAGLEKSMQYRNSGNMWWKGYWSVRTAVGGMIIQHYAVTTTKEKVGVPAGLAVEAVMMFAPDTDFLLKYLRSTNMPVPQIAQTVSSLATVAEQEVTASKFTQDEIEKLKKLWEKALKKSTLSHEELTYLTSEFGKTWEARARAGEIVTGDAELDAWIAAKAVKQSVPAAPNKEAESALEEFKKDIAQKVEDEQKLATDARTTSDKLSAGASAPPPSGGPPDPLAKEAFLTIDENGRPHWDVKPDSMLGQAEAALREGDFKKARELYEDAFFLFAEYDHDIESAVLKWKLDLVSELEALQTTAGAGKSIRPPKPPGVSDLAKDLTPDEVKAILAQKADWKTGEIPSGATSTVHTVGDKYVVKQMLSDDPELIKRCAESEVIGARMARELGLDAPAVSVVEKDGQTYFIFRRVDGTQLARPLEIAGKEVQMAQTVLYGDELSEHRALSLLLGDADRHPGNYMVGRDGSRLFAIDSAGAELRNSYSGSAMYELMRDNWLIRGTVNVKTGDPDYRSKLMAELAISYGDRAKAMVQKIDGLVKDEAKLKGILSESYRGVHPDMPQAGIDGLVNQTVQVFKERNNQLGPLMQSLSKRNLGSR